MTDKYFYLSKEWRKIRKKALERDNYTCQDCGEQYSDYLYNKKGPRLVVHHIEHRPKGGEDTLNNAVTLCTKCHGKRHKEEDEQFGR